MTKILMPVGIPGSGKSYIIDACRIMYKNPVVISSDSIREEIYGDENIQGDPKEVFRIANERVEQAINDKTVDAIYYDATNLYSKKRKAFIRKFKREGVEIEAHVISRDLYETYEANELRERTVPHHVMNRMLLAYSLPTLSEGFDEVKYILNNCKDPNFYGVLSKFELENISSYEAYINSPVMLGNKMLFNTREFAQDSKHHSFSLSRHCYLAYEFIKEEFPDLGGNKRFVLMLAALLHDVGKPYCKTFKNTKGEDSRYAHYYSHENVSASVALNMLLQNQKELKLSDDDITFIVTLIQNHMRPYNAKSEKSINKLEKDMGSRETFISLDWIHNADVAAH